MVRVWVQGGRELKEVENAGAAVALDTGPLEVMTDCTGLGTTVCGFCWG